MGSGISRFARGTLALAGAAGLAVVCAAPAGAVSWDHVYSAKGVTVYVREHDDYIAVCDTAKNGHSAWVFVAASNSDTHHYKMTVTAGKGRCEVHHAAEGGMYNMPEGVNTDLVFAGNGENRPFEYHTRYFLNDH